MNPNSSVFILALKCSVLGFCGSGERLIYWYRGVEFLAEIVGQNLCGLHYYAIRVLWLWKLALVLIDLK